MPAAVDTVISTFAAYCTSVRTQNCSSFTRRPNRGWCAQKAQPGLSIGYTDLAAVDAAAPMEAPDSIALTLRLAAWPSPDASKVYAEPACKCAATCTDACPAEVWRGLVTRLSSLSYSTLYATATAWAQDWHMAQCACGSQEALVTCLIIRDACDMFCVLLV